MKLPVKVHPGFFNPHRMRAVPREMVYAGVTESRRLQSEFPMADPMGGPAYGQLAMPVVAVAAAVATFATGASVALAAGASIGAMVAGGAMMVGAAMSAVGAITGNQKLMKIGGVLSLAGGIGAGIMGMTGGLTESATSMGTEMAGDAASGAFGDAAGATASDAAGKALAEIPPESVGVGTAPNQVQVGNAGGLLDAPAAPAATAQPTQAGAMGATPPSGAMGVGDSVQTMGSEVAGSVNKVDALGGNGMLDKVSGWVKNNKELAKLGVDAFGGIAKAFPSDAEKAQAELLRQRAEEQKRRNNWWSGPRKGS